MPLTHFLYRGEVASKLCGWACFFLGGDGFDLETASQVLRQDYVLVFSAIPAPGRNGKPKCVAGRAFFVGSRLRIESRFQGAEARLGQSL